MENIEIDITKINTKNIFKTKDGIIFLIIDGMFCKLLHPKNFEFLGFQESYVKLEEKLNDLEKNHLDEIEDAVIPKIKYYYKGKLVGYATEFQNGYGDFIGVANSLGAIQKLDLLIMLSKGVKKIHEHNFVHTDIYNSNVLTNGTDIKIIDFDEGHSFVEDAEVTYFNSPDSDVAQINNLFTRLLTNGKKIILDNTVSCEIPRELKEYMNKYDINSFDHFEQVVKAKMPEEYPHELFEKLKESLYVNNSHSSEKSFR